MAEGKLTLVATPIGNLSDMSPRAVSALKDADIIAAEDTRNTIKLLNHFDIKVPLTSYHEYNRVEKAKELILKMQEGKNIALVTDAGMPAISDPGEELVRFSRESGIEISIIPGPCAAVCALALSGLDTRRFCFEGFLPADKKERAKRLEELNKETRTFVIYEAPHRLLKTLEELKEALGENRKLVIARELTKVHEETVLTTLKEAAEKYINIEPKGEFVLVIEGKEERQEDNSKNKKEFLMPLSEAEHVAVYERRGFGRTEAMRLAAKDRGVAKRDIYNALLSEKEEERRCLEYKNT